jgi:hypothetical protein
MYHKLQHETIPKLLQLKKQPLKLYLALCQYAKIGDGVCWPGYIRLGKETKITSGAAMKRAISVLDETGLITTWMDGNKRFYQILE